MTKRFLLAVADRPHAAPRPASTEPMTSGRFVLVFGTAALAAGCDQVLKAAMVQSLAGSDPVAIAPFLNLRLGLNTGGSFSMLAETLREAPYLLIAVMSSIVLLVVLLAVRVKRRVDALAFAFIAGGAVGNILDRTRIGAVVDYIDLHYDNWHWLTFNLADVFIVGGVALFVGIGLFNPKRDASNP